MILNKYFLKWRASTTGKSSQTSANIFHYLPATSHPSRQGIALLSPAQWDCCE